MDKKPEKNVNNKPSSVYNPLSSFKTAHIRRTSFRFITDYVHITRISHNFFDIPIGYL